MTVLTAIGVVTLVLFNVWALITEPFESNRFNKST